MSVISYRDLIVWQKSITFVKELYEVTENFPKAELFGLTSQMRRAAVSIPSNIAEGFSRKHRKEYCQFLLIAFGSGAELETQIILAKELDFLHNQAFERLMSLLEEVRKMLNKMIHMLSNPRIS